MIKVCEAPGCGAEFDAKRKHAKYHSETCRKRAQRKPAEVAAAAPKPASRKPVKPVSYLEAATQAELARAGRSETAAGRQALMLARRLDCSANETLAAVAAAMREHANAMDRALRDGPASDPVQARADEVGLRRDQQAKAS